MQGGTTDDDDDDDDDEVEEEEEEEEVEPRNRVQRIMMKRTRGSQAEMED